jgi:D-cysteine desulfhydrase family pyridoxal phosphate-dependent enzyme
MINLSFTIKEIPKIDLCLLPTPIVPLNRLSEYLKGPQIYMKRDDLTGVAFGGNKNRKLEYLLSDALNDNADTIITEGATNSNHCLQTAACATKVGLDCELILSGEEPSEYTGNFLLFKILDVPTYIVSTSPERKICMKEREKKLISEGKTPYIIPTGGSNALGALGYVNCISEVEDQIIQLNNNNKTFDFFVHAAGSSGTQAGLLIGKELYQSNMSILSVTVVDDTKHLEKETKKIIGDFSQRFQTGRDLKQIPIKIITGYEGPGYGLPSKEMVETIKLVSKLEGVFLDPVYNGKAMVGLIDMIKIKQIQKDEKVLFLHSGGGPSIFNYSHVFS